jgi:hypothetical protein
MFSMTVVFKRERKTRRNNAYNMFSYIPTEFFENF